MGNRLSNRVTVLEQEVETLKEQIVKLEKKQANTLEESISKKPTGRGSRSKRNSFNVEKYQQEIQRTLQKAGEDSDDTHRVS